MKNPPASATKITPDYLRAQGESIQRSIAQATLELEQAKQKLANLHGALGYNRALQAEFGKDAATSEKPAGMPPT